MNYYSEMCLNFYVEEMSEIEYAAASDPRISRSCPLFLSECIMYTSLFHFNPVTD